MSTRQASFMASLRLPPVLAATLLAAGWMAMAPSSAAAADTTDAASRAVRYGDLQLDDPEDTATLYRRLRSAAREVCDAFESREPGRQVQVRACVKTALANAVADVGHPAVVSYHAARTGSPQRLAAR